MVTLPPRGRDAWHVQAVEHVAMLARARVYLHPTLHAKFFIGESRQGAYAVVGSANLTQKGGTSREVGIAISGRSWGQELISELVLLGQSLRTDPGVARVRR
jgi:phosphatidylserine/phosphatidylglycerophosphate/cardiolipin synthase-like enzyme